MSNTETHLNSDIFNVPSIILPLINNMNFFFKTLKHYLMQDLITTKYI